jgi:hypothetical protein
MDIVVCVSEPATKDDLKALALEIRSEFRSELAARLAALEQRLVLEMGKLVATSRA